MELGNVLKRDVCNPKLCRKSNVIVDTLPVLIALGIVAFLSGSLFRASGMDLPVIIAAEGAFVAVCYGLLAFMMGNSQKLQAQTGIWVCEGGICGVCGAGAMKNRNFTLPYSEIVQVTVKGERIFIQARRERVILNLADTTATAALIQSKLH